MTVQSPPCRWCGRTTANPNDIANGYCPCCGGSYMPKDCEHRPGTKEYFLSAWTVEEAVEAAAEA